MSGEALRDAIAQAIRDTSVPKGTSMHDYSLAQADAVLGLVEQQLANEHARPWIHEHGANYRSGYRRALADALAAIETLETYVASDGKRGGTSITVDLDDALAVVRRLAEAPE